MNRHREEKNTAYTAREEQRTQRRSTCEADHRLRMRRRTLFAEDSRYQAWLDVEAAGAGAGRLRIIPRTPPRRSRGRRGSRSWTGRPSGGGSSAPAHSLVPLIWELDRVCEATPEDTSAGAPRPRTSPRPDSCSSRGGRTTSSSGNWPRCSRSGAAGQRAKDMLLPGRARAARAPATFGFKVAVWIDGCAVTSTASAVRAGLRRDARRSAGDGLPRADQHGGQDKMAERLGMTPMLVPRSISDRRPVRVPARAPRGDVQQDGPRVLLKQEFGEVEAVPPSTVGSSTMRRRIPSSPGTSSPRPPRCGRWSVGAQAMQTEHEADRTTSIMLDRAITEACTQTGDILERLIALFSRLTLFPEHMRRTSISGGLIMSGRSCWLGTQMGRQRARRGVRGGEGGVHASRPARDLLVEDAHVRISSRRISDGALDRRGTRALPSVRGGRPRAGTRRPHSPPASPRGPGQRPGLSGRGRRTSMGPFRPLRRRRGTQVGARRPRSEN